MNKLISILAIILLMFAGCGGSRKSGNDSDTFITINVRTSYPQKELILQDFMDVEYIALETGGEFYTQGVVLDIGKNYILLRNRVNDGNIYVFDRNGKGLRVINRRGQGPEEYLWNTFTMLDEENGEIFVNDNSKNSILVYDLFGNFKRHIRHQEGVRYGMLHNFDSESWIFKNETRDREASTPSFFIKSKHDGSIVKEIIIPFEEWKTPIQSVRNPENNSVFSIGPSAHSDITPYQGQWILVELSSDTVYRYFPDHSMSPFWVRTPSIQSTNPEIFVLPGIFTDDYYFFRIYTKDYNFDTQRGSDEIQLMYNKEARKIFEYVIFNNDYSDRRRISMSRRTLNDEIAFWQSIEADILLEDYENGVLNGKLKEIAAGLKEEDNPVIMLVKHKR